MSRKGDCWDNAVAESFFSTLKTELGADRIYASHDEATATIELPPVWRTPRIA
jgi:putative transposase